MHSVVIEQNLMIVIIDLLVLNGVWCMVVYVCVSVFRAASLSFYTHFVAANTWGFLQWVR